jgi:hypothetical protein
MLRDGNRQHNPGPVSPVRISQYITGTNTHLDLKGEWSLNSLHKDVIAQAVHPFLLVPLCKFSDVKCNFGSN